MHVTKATLSVSGHPALLLIMGVDIIMGVDMSELVSMDILGLLLAHEGMSINILSSQSPVHVKY